MSKVWPPIPHVRVRFPKWPGFPPLLGIARYVQSAPGPIGAEAFQIGPLGKPLL